MYSSLLRTPLRLNTTQYLFMDFMTLIEHVFYVAEIIASRHVLAIFNVKILQVLVHLFLSFGLLHTVVLESKIRTNVLFSTVNASHSFL